MKGISWAVFVGCFWVEASALASPPAFDDYQKAVICSVRKYNLGPMSDPDPLRNCESLDVELGILIAHATLLRAAAKKAVEALEEPDRARKLAKLTELTEKLAAVREAEERRRTEQSRSGQLAPETTWDEQGSESSGRPGYALYWSSGSQGTRYYLSTTANRVVEFQPRLYRAFLEEQLKVKRPMVAGELPPELVRDDVDTLIAKLRETDATVLKRFAQTFPIAEGSALAEDLEATGPAASKARENHLQLGTELARQKKLRTDELQQSGKPTSFQYFDRNQTRAQWLRNKGKVRDPWLVRDLLQGSSTNLHVGKPGGEDLLVPVRPETKVEVRGESELRIDNVTFKLQELKQVEPAPAGQQRPNPQ